VLERFQFAPAKHLYIVEIYRRILVLGVSGDNITVLTEIDTEEEKSEIHLKISHGLVGRNFSEYFQEATGGRPLEDVE
jgi:flagellar biogenesis protein FliO